MSLSLICGWIFAVIANALVIYDIWYERTSLDDKAALMSLLLFVPVILITIPSLLFFISSGWINWYLTLFVLPLYLILNIINLFIRG